MSETFKPVMDLKIEFTKIFIGNEFVDSKSGKTFASINPATGKKLADIQEGDKADVELAVAAAKTAFKRGSVWRRTNASERGDLLMKLAALLIRDKAVLSTLETLDNGKPFHASLVDIDDAVSILKYFGGLADKLVGDTIPLDGSDLMVYTRREPVGVVAGIVPWNYPLSIAVSKLAPSIAAGCTVVIKPAEQTPLTAIYLAKLVKEVGFPAGVVNIVPGYGETAGAALVQHAHVNKVTFTGSTEVGRLIMKGSADTNLKRVSLELGGKSPNIVFPDVDLDYAVEVSSDAVLGNMGQVCCAGTRTYVHEAIYDQFVKKSVLRAQSLKVGDPFNPDTFNGPQIDEIQTAKILELIESGRNQGAKLHCGGMRVAGMDGYFIHPTVFSDVKGDMRIAREEIFGPVQCILKFKDAEEAIEMANDTHYGLAAAVFTKDINTAITVSNAIEAGTVWVNCYNQSPRQAPFGGYKTSGINREYGLQGCDAYLETKTVMIKTKQ